MRNRIESWITFYLHEMNNLINTINSKSFQSNEYQNLILLRIFVAYNFEFRKIKIFIWMCVLYFYFTFSIGACACNFVFFSLLLRQSIYRIENIFYFSFFLNKMLLAIGCYIDGLVWFFTVKLFVFTLMHLYVDILWFQASEQKQQQTYYKIYNHFRFVNIQYFSSDWKSRKPSIVLSIKILLLLLYYTHHFFLLLLLKRVETNWWIVQN